MARVLSYASEAFRPRIDPMPAGSTRDDPHVLPIGAGSRTTVALLVRLFHYQDKRDAPNESIRSYIVNYWLRAIAAVTDNTRIIVAFGCHEFQWCYLLG
jgi:hypothetical protein